MISLTVLVLLCMGFHAQAEKCKAQADVVFLIDSSSSIHKDNFTLQIKFVDDIIDNFDIAPDKTQVAAVTFSDQVVHQFQFDAKMTKAAIKNKINLIAHKSGLATYTDDGLKAMRALFTPGKGHREGVPKICILLTDGGSTRPTATMNEANISKSEDIKIITIGIGKEINIAELKDVASEPIKDNLIIASGFSSLNSFKSLVDNAACEAAKTTPAPTTTTTTQKITSTPDEMRNDEGDKVCQGKKADIVFILDKSSSIWEIHFKEQLQFVSDIIDRFDIDTGKTQVGCIVFSDNAINTFNFNSFGSKAEIQKAVKSIKHGGGITNTHKALELAKKMFSTKTYGVRPGVAHIAILITDGRSSMPSLTVPAASELIDQGVYVFAIGVGNMTDRAELEKMASNPQNVFEVEDGYQALPIIKDKLAYKTCEVPQNDQPGCAKNIQSKIMFGLYGIGGRERPEVTAFIKNFGETFYKAKANVEIGVLESCKQASVDLIKFAGPEVYAETIQNEVATDARSFASFLKTMSRTLPSDREIVASENKQNSAILFVAGNPGVTNDAISLAGRFRFYARIMVISIGEDKAGELSLIASSKNTGQQDMSHYFHLNKASDLKYLLKKVIGRMCIDQ